MPASSNATNKHLPSIVVIRPSISYCKVFLIYMISKVKIWDSHSEANIHWRAMSLVMYVYSSPFLLVVPVLLGTRG